MNKTNIEIILNPQNHSPRELIIGIVKKYLQNIDIKSNCLLKNFDRELHPALYDNVKAVIIDTIKENDILSDDINWFLYKLDIHGPMTQTEDDKEEEIEIATHYLLPSTEFFNLWENLYYSEHIKENLLKYAQTMMEFSDKGVDTNIINCNRIILLHGPPGTGKTSLCKALAQKLSIRMQERYNSGLLVEINSHSLFSKWFSESGKLVTKMFTKIKELVENKDVFICVLIDEVESLAHARSQCLSGNDPSDAVRVVNALLTQIDQIKRYSNVLILTTSNITGSIDLAFIDRADIKQYIGLPTVEAIYQVYYSCISELIKDEKRLRVFENKVLRKIFGAKRDETTGEWRKFHNIELHQLYNSPDIVNVIKSRRLRWAGHVARIEENRTAYEILMGKDPWMNCCKIGYAGREWRDVARDRERWRDLTQIISNGDELETPEMVMKQDKDSNNECTRKLLDLCENSVGLSGRSLKKIPFIAHALFLAESFVGINKFLEAMDKAVTREKNELRYFSHKN